MKPNRPLARSHFSVRRILVVIGVLGLLGFIFLFMNVPKSPAVTGSIKYLDANLPIEVRVADLLAQMTLAEKIGQMALVEKNSLRNISDISTAGLGGVLSGAGAKPAVNTAAGWSELVNSYHTEAQQSRLGIPVLYGVDAVHGHALVPGATVFPHQIGLGAAGDADLVEQIARATAHDLSVTGVNWNYAPNLDLPTDIRWGRMYEAFSDDPILTTRLGRAYVRGLQAPIKGTSSPSVLATLKHFAGVGAMQWDTSTNKNFKIDQGVTKENLADLRTIYLPPFKAAIDAGALSVMIGLHVWGETKLITNKEIIQGELKTNLGFNGFVVSDWYGVYEGAGNKFIATVRAINAGVDMVMLPFDYKTFIRQVTWAQRLGFISVARIDDAASRILRAKFTAGLFDSQSTTTNSFGNYSKLSRQAVAQSLVLLKNDGDVLPLKQSVRHIKVAGSAADNVGLQSGAWTVEWQGVDGNWLPQGTSILAGIRDLAGPGVRVEYNERGEFVPSANKTPVGIVIVGEKPYAEGWGDREYPVLAEADLQAIKNLQTTCEQVVVVLVSGRPLLIANEVASWDALVAAWLPGTAGGGVADVLFGKAKFMGTLPVPWPKTSQQLPITTQGETKDGTAVLFPRYYGLSY